MPAPEVDRAVPDPEPPSSEPALAAEVASSGPETSIESSEGSLASKAGGMDLGEVRRLWPSVLDRVKVLRRAVWMMLFEKSQVLDVDARQLTIGLPDPGSVKNFGGGGKDELVRQAVIDVLGIDVQVVAVLDPSGPGGVQAPPKPAERPDPATKPVPRAAAEARAEAAKVDRPVVGQAREAGADVDDTAAADDPDADDVGLAGHDLIAQQLGGRVIGEIEHD